MSEAPSDPHGQPYVSRPMSIAPLPMRFRCSACPTEFGYCRGCPSHPDRAPVDEKRKEGQ